MSALAGSAAAQITDSVVIVGSGAEQRAFDTPYAVGVIDAATLRSSGPLVNLSEALARVPGLTVNLRNNYAQDLQISSRGFGARASFGVRGIRLVADGIPAAGPDGQGQVSHFDLAGADRIEVLRGPFSALYGTSSGGVIALVTRSPSARSAAVEGDLGSDGLGQLRLTLEAPFEGGWSLRASASHFQTEGLRPQSEARRGLANLRLARENDHDRIVIVLNALDQPAQDPLGLTREQFNANPDQTAAVATQFDTRKTTRQSQAGLQWQHRFDAGMALQRGALALYAGERGVTQWQSIAPAAQTNPRHPGGVIDFDRRFQGLDARLYWRLGSFSAVTGAALDRQQEDRRGFENFTGSGAAQQFGVTGRLRREEDNRARSSDLFAQGDVELAEGLMASAGVRRSRLNIESADRFLGNGDDSGRLRFGATLPMAALRWQPGRAWSLYLSAGRGFEAPTLGELAYRSDGQGGFNTALRPQRSRQWELGAKWRDAALGVVLDAAVFAARTRDEIGVQSNVGGRSTFQNVGRTSRSGAEAALQWRIASAWRAMLSVTRLDARYDEGFLTCTAVPCTTPNQRVQRGNRIAGTLPASGFAEIVWSGGAFELGLEARGQGRQPVNDLNSDFAAGHGLLALRGLWRQRFGDGQLEALARIDNLADRRVAGSVIVNEGNARFFEPAAGRSLLLSLRWRQAF